MVVTLPKNTNNDQKKCPQCGIVKKLDIFFNKKVCNDCIQKNKLTTSRLFGIKKPAEEDEDSGGARKLELEHTRDVETLGHEIELNKEAEILREELEKKDKERRFLSKKKTFIEQQERILLMSEESLETKEREAEPEPLESELEKQEREKIAKSDDGPSDSPLKNSSRFRQMKKMETEKNQQKQKISQLYHTQKKSETDKLISKEIKEALTIAFRRWL